MKVRVEKICVTCQHFEPYHCTLDDHYIGYLYCEMPTNCKAYRLSDNYKKGGKFSDEGLQRTDSVTDRPH